MNYDKYEIERRTKQHEEVMAKIHDRQQCLHKNCAQCGGTGKRKDGTVCVHMISCSCDRCSHAKMVCRKDIAVEYPLSHF